MQKVKNLSLIILLMTVCGLWGQNESGPYSRRTPIVEAFERNKDAVVSITSKTVTEVRDSLFDFWSMDNYPFSRKMVVPSLGSGFVINRKGYVITNNHVIQGADEITVNMADGQKYGATVVATNKTSDLAVLKIDSDKTFPAVQLGYSDDLMIGETVLAIGNPYGYQHTLTDGIISAIHRDLQMSDDVVMPDLIQISAPINPGNSGGPLLNINGELIGINTAIRKAAQGIGFAIPVDRLRQSMGDMLSVEKLRRIDLGMTVCDCKRRSDYKGKAVGLFVETIKQDSGSARAGFRVGDVITGLSGLDTLTEIDFYLNLLERQENETLAFDVDRNGQKVRLSLELIVKPKPDGQDLARKMFGFNVIPLTDQLKRSKGLAAGERGNVLVNMVDRDSPADNAGIEQGDLIVAINGEPVKDVDQLGLLMEQIQPDMMVNVTIYRTRTSRFGYQIFQYDAKLRARDPENPAAGATTPRFSL